MYAGRIVEKADTDTIFAAPEHPYTWGLLSSIPRLDSPRGEELVPIPGRPPSLINLPGGCSFHPRCPYVREAHKTDRSQARARAGQPDHQVACLLDPETSPQALERVARGRQARRRPRGRDGRGEGRMSVRCAGEALRMREHPAGAGREDHGGRRDLFKHFPIHAGFFRARSARSRPSTASPSTSCAARRSGSWASRAAASRPPRGCCCG